MGLNVDLGACYYEVLDAEGCQQQLRAGGTRAPRGTQKQTNKQTTSTGIHKQTSKQTHKQTSLGMDLDMDVDWIWIWV